MAVHASPEQPDMGLDEFVRHMQLAEQGKVEVTNEETGEIQLWDLAIVPVPEEGEDQ
ncbi:MAG TPA: hypothetical protein VK674_02785 [Candidatus Limnocylindria bacterium]|nr:hypothetical protein [Candidatus Limnocylindria bacterium]